MDDRSDSGREPRDDGGKDEASQLPPSPSRFEPRRQPDAPVCEICGTVMYDRHCKIACPNCGYLRDCSDP